MEWEYITLEIFGYIGTALVIISMMMTNWVKFRVLNMCGGLISLIYAVLCNTWPVVVLNGCLICINFVQTVRYIKQNKHQDAQNTADEGGITVKENNE